MNVFIYPSVILGFNFGTTIDIFVEAVFFIPMLSVGIRRFHDRNYSAWWYGAFIGYGYAIFYILPFLFGFFLAFMPADWIFKLNPVVFLLYIISYIIYGITLIVVLFILALSGSKGANRYGLNPLSSIPNVNVFE